MKKFTITIFPLLLVVFGHHAVTIWTKRYILKYWMKPINIRRMILKQTLPVHTIRCALTIRCTIGMWKNNRAVVS